MILIKLLTCLIIGLVITNVTLSNRAVDQSTLVSQLSQEITQLEHENMLMSVAIAELGSLSKLRVQIEQAGFVVADDVVALSGSSAVASR